ncbi:MAG: hypothetical protein F4Y44_03175 [Chloroflexi bacterium]|nr:hypothetical protein [Chloroflexota bacterium]
MRSAPYEPPHVLAGYLRHPYNAALSPKSGKARNNEPGTLGKLYRPELRGKRFRQQDADIETNFADSMAQHSAVAQSIPNHVHSRVSRWDGQNMSVNKPQRGFDRRSFVQPGQVRIIRVSIQVGCLALPNLNRELLIRDKLFGSPRR